MTDKCPFRTASSYNVAETKDCLQEECKFYVEDTCMIFDFFQGELED